MEIQQISEQVFASSTNILAAIIIIGLTLLALFGTFSKSSNHKIRHFARQSPAILATVGIFFSFWGISIGLIGLDLNDIQNSIPKLLDGLKVKFIASLMGIGASIIVRIAQNFAVEDIIEKDNDEKIVNLLGDIHKVLANNANNSPETLLQELKEEIGKLPIEFGKQTLLLESIKTSLAGDNDGSVTTQLLKVRTAITDKLDSIDSNNRQRSESLNSTLTSKFDNLTQEFRNFAEKAAENNSKAFIEALATAMNEFNKNLAEQFGENFKQLNQAVGELLTWQDNYKSHVETLTGNFEVALNSVATIQTAFSDIQTRSESFTEVSTELGGILQKLDLQLQDLNHHLKSLDQVADSAKQAFPIIEDNLIKLTTGFKKSTEQSLADITSTVETVGENLVETTSRLKDTMGKLRDSMENQRETLEKTSDEFKEVVGVTLKSLAKETKASIETYQESLQEAVTTQLDSIHSNIKQSNAVVNSTIQNASTEFEKAIVETGAVLKTSTNTVANHLSGATDAMQGMMVEQQSALNSTSAEFKTVVNQTLRDLSRDTQVSIHDYQTSLQQAVTQQLNSIDANIQQSNAVVNSTIQNASATFEKSITETGLILKATTNTVSDHISNVAYQLSNSTNAMKEMIDNQKDTLNATSNEFRTVVNQTLRDLSEQSKLSIREYENNLHNAVTNASKEFNRLLQENAQNSNDILKQQTQLLDTALQTKLKKTIEEMGSHLVSLSAKFVEDYTPLTEKLREVVRLADDLNRGRL